MSGDMELQEETSGDCQFCAYSNICATTYSNPMIIDSTGLIFCSICNFACQSKIHVLDHARGVHFDSNLPECNLCKCKFSNKSLWKRHHLEHIEDQFVCGICDFKSNLRNQVTQHCIDQHITDKPASCSVCHKIGENKNDFQAVTQNKVFVHLTCKNCMEIDVNVQPQPSTSNKKEETPPVKFRCKFCKESRDTKTELMKHMTYDHIKNIFSCDVCRYACNVEDHLLKHKKNRHIPKSDTSNCQMCGLGLPQRHALNDTESKNCMQIFTCPFCEYKCNVLQHWMKHVRDKHPVESMNICSFCEKSKTEK